MRKTLVILSTCLAVVQSQPWIMDKRCYKRRRELLEDNLFELDDEMSMLDSGSSSQLKVEVLPNAASASNLRGSNSTGTMTARGLQTESEPFMLKLYWQPLLSTRLVLLRLIPLPRIVAS